MKRRELKKEINLLCGDLFAECVALIYFKDKPDTKDIENIMLTIIKLQDDMVSRLSHVEPGSTKLFFKKFHEEFAIRTEEIISQINALV